MTAPGAWIRALWPMLAAVVAWKLLDGGFELLLEPGAEPVVAVAATAVAAVVAYVAVEMVLLDRDASEIGLGSRRAIPQLAVGVSGGAGAFGAVVAIAWLLGWYEPDGLQLPAPGVFVAAVLTWLFVAAGEEIVFRGMVLRRAAIAWGSAIGLVVSALVFGAAHLPTAGSWHEAMLLGASGTLLFGVAWLAARSLWLPIGLHLGWNLTQDLLLGSGAGTEAALTDARLDAPVWAMGRSDTPEAGIVALAVCAAVAIVTWSRRDTSRSNIL